MLTQETVERPAVRTRFDYWWLVAVGSVIVAVLFASLYSPDMITGSSHEHLPLAAFSDWLWGSVAIGYLSYVRRDRSDATFGISVGVLWLAVALTSIFASPFVTGSDPTTIPLAALIAPVVGAIVTGFLALHAVSRRE
jgi:predicted MFS family arabinose efflux permease